MVKPPSTYDIVVRTIAVIFGLAVLVFSGIVLWQAGLVDRFYTTFVGAATIAIVMMVMAYERGFNRGRAYGLSSSHDDAYTEGHTVGYRQGYDEGYEDGQGDAEDDAELDQDCAEGPDDDETDDEPRHRVPAVPFPPLLFVERLGERAAVPVDDVTVRRDDLSALLETFLAYRKAVEKIRTEEGLVCVNYETCSHGVCESSYRAWATADAAIYGREPVEKRLTEPAPGVDTPS